MSLHNDWTEYDGMEPRQRYDAIGTLIDEAKSQVAAKRAEIAHDLATEVGPREAARILDVSPSRVYGLAARHRQAQAADTTTYMDWADACDSSARRLPQYIRDLLEDSGIDVARMDLEAVRGEYRDAILAELPEGVEFTGAAFIGPAPVPSGIREEIRAAVARADFWEIVARHDPDAVSA
jgi:hypothetical protein